MGPADVGSNLGHSDLLPISRHECWATLCLTLSSRHCRGSSLCRNAFRPRILVQRAGAIQKSWDVVSLQRARDYVQRLSTGCSLHKLEWSFWSCWLEVKYDSLMITYACLPLLAADGYSLLTESLLCPSLWLASLYSLVSRSLQRHSFSPTKILN